MKRAMMRGLIAITLAGGITRGARAQDGATDVTSVRSCTAAMSKVQAMLTLYGSEGVVDICRCAVPKIAAKYSVAEQQRLNALPQARGAIYVARDTTYQAYLALQSDVGARCAKDVSDPGWEAREAAQVARELAERKAQRRADSVQRVADDARAAARRASDSLAYAEQSAKARAADESRRLAVEAEQRRVKTMKDLLADIGRMEDLYAEKVGQGRCSRNRAVGKVLGGILGSRSPVTGSSEKPCNPYFNTLDELQSNWKAVTEGLDEKWTNERYHVAGVSLAFDPAVVLDYSVTAKHDSTRVRCVARSKVGVSCF